MDNLRIRNFEVKQKLNNEYGIYTNEDLKSVYHSGKTMCQATCYIDTDSVIIAHDKTLCMYDHAGEILEVLNDNDD